MDINDGGPPRKLQPLGLVVTLSETRAAAEMPKPPGAWCPKFATDRAALSDFVAPDVFAFYAGTHFPCDMPPPRMPRPHLARKRALHFGWLVDSGLSCECGAHVSLRNSWG